METMRVWELTSIGNLRLAARPVPRPGAGEVLVRVKHVGICGSDLHYYEHGRIGGFVVEYPFVLGHETGGEIAELGEGVCGLSVGQAVALEPGATCGHCPSCKKGLYNLCPDVVFHATPPYDGTLCEYVVHPAELCFPLPKGVGTMEGALMEPLCVGMHAAYQGAARVGQSALVLGGGCIGLCTALSLKQAGLMPVAVSEPLDLRREMAKKLGFAAFSPANDSPADIAAKLFPEGFDVVVETSGAPIAALQTVDAVARGGTIVMVGLSPDPVLPFNFGKLIDKEAAVRTVFRYRNLYPAAISAVAGGLQISEIVTNTFGFAEADSAFKFCSENKQAVVKAVIEL